MVGCELNDDSGTYITQGLMSHSSSIAAGKEGKLSTSFSGIKVLILHHNNLSDETALGFSEQLVKHNLPLYRLDLSHNRINDAGGECIARSLYVNTSLKYLNLKRNNLKDTTGLLFVDACKQNKTLQILNLEKNQISPNIIE